jgi:hypothetical protein
VNVWELEIGTWELTRRVFHQPPRLPRAASAALMRIRT